MSNEYMKKKLQDHTAKKSSYVLDRLSPLIRKRVEVLIEFQCEHDELEVKFFEERAVLGAKYQKLYQPLYTKRYEIVNGVVEVEETATDTANILEGEESSEEKGVPDFWLTVMGNNAVTGREIYAHDKGALKFLKDIKCSMINDPKGFKLEFFFNSNPYFKNSVLTKTYQLIDEDDPVLEKPIGTEIEWHTCKCLTQKIVRKNPKKGSNMRIPKTVQCESFFNFFSPPEVAENDDEDEDKALRHLMEEDYYVGHAIKDQIIPHAVTWFTGDALKGLVEYYDDEDDDEESEDDQDHTGKKSSHVLDRLSPLVRKRVEVLREFQCEHDELVVQFFEERAVLEAKYYKLYQPLYTKRYEIVNGVVEVEETATDAAKIQEGEESSEEKGVPEFWRSAMGFNKFTGREMSYDDGMALKFLKDIKWSRIDDPKGFKLEFFFDTNPYFKNSFLTKTYHLIDEDEHIPEKAIGTEIEWHTGKCLTQKMFRQKLNSEKDYYTWIPKTGQCKSFFRFFSPPEVPENDNVDEAELLHNLMEQDYDIGHAIKDNIIPHAVSWFTGDALRGFLESDDDEVAYSEEDGKDDEEDAFSEEEEEYHPKYRKKNGVQVRGPLFRRDGSITRLHKKRFEEATDKQTMEIHKENEAVKMPKDLPKKSVMCCNLA